MRRAFTILVCFTLFGPQADAGSIQKVVTTSVGTGLTLQQAITDGLVNAIRQVDGAAISDQQLSQSASLTVSDGNNSAYLTSRLYSSRVIAISHGVVTGFVVEHYGHSKTSIFTAARRSLDRLLGRPDHVAPGMWTARLQVTVAKFQRSANEKRVRIAVFPPRVSHASFDVLGAHVPSHVIARHLADGVENYLVDTHNLTVLNRRHTPEVKTELQRIRTGATPTKDYALLGQTLIANYVLVGTIQHLDYRLIHRPSLTGHHVYTTATGEMSVSYRLINVATQQVVLSSVQRAHFSRFLPFGKTLRPSAVLHDDLTQISHAMGRSVVRYLYPVRILAAQGHRYIIGAGRGVIKAGQVYTILRDGAEIINPDTHESLGSAQTYCCQIRIYRVTQRLAYGKLLPPAQALKDLTPTSYVLGHVVVQARRPASAQAAGGVQSVEAIIQEQDRNAAKHQ
jgi:hypothetical protein